MIAHGPSASLGSQGQMGPVYLLKGNLKEELSFTIPPGVDGIGQGTDQTLCLNNTPSGLVATSVIPVYLNGFKNDLYTPEISQEPQHTPSFTIELLGTRYFSGLIKGQQGHQHIWELSIKPDRPLQTIQASLSGANEWHYVQFPNMTKSEVDYPIDIADLPEEATITIRATDGHGHEIGPFAQAVNTKKMISYLPSFWMARLKQNPQQWVKIYDNISDEKTKRLSFHILAQARCALKEIRYSVDDKSLSHRFSLAPCNVNDMESYLSGVQNAFDTHGNSALDQNERIEWPKNMKFVAVQLVFFDSSVSEVIIERNEAEESVH